MTRWLAVLVAAGIVSAGCQSAGAVAPMSPESRAPASEASAPTSSAQLESQRRAETAASNLERTGYVVGGAGILSACVGTFMAIQRINTVARVDYAQRLEASGTPTNIDAIEAQRDRHTIGMGVGLGLGLPLVVAGGVMVVVGRHRRDQTSRLALVPGGLALRF